jgi:branched-chain amino acid aminotransferase
MPQDKQSSLPGQVQIWIDGEQKQAENAQVSVLDRGFLYGDSVFETLRTYGGEPFALEAHLSRLKESASRVLIELPVELNQMAEEVRSAIEQAGFDESYVRVMVTRGQGALGLDPRVATKPLRVLIVTPLSSPPLGDYEDGIAVITYETSRVPDETPAAGAKIGNYLVAVLAHQKAGEAGAKEALIKNARGEVVEGATSNVFWMKDGKLWTPPLSAGILAGITRHHILEAAKDLGLSVETRVPTVQELLDSDGVFISSSIREMLPVVSIDGKKVSAGKVPELTRNLHAQFRKNAGAPPLATSGLRPKA